MADYQKMPGGYILRLRDEAMIPSDEENRDYREYLVWLDQGNEPDPEPKAPEQGPEAPKDE